MGCHRESISHLALREPFHRGEASPFRAPYLLSQFAVDAGPSWPWAGLPRPGLGIGRESLEEERFGGGMGTCGGHDRYADVPREVS